MAPESAAVSALRSLIPAHLDRTLRWITLKLSKSTLEELGNAVKESSHLARRYRTVDTYTTTIWHGFRDLPRE